MSRTNHRLGLPLGGVNREARTLIPLPQTDQWTAPTVGGFRFARGRQLQPWPFVGGFADATDLNTITRLFNIRWGDGTGSLVRHTNATFGHLIGGVWAAVTPGAGFPTVTDSRWGADLVTSVEAAAGNNGNGVYMFSNRLIGPYYWFPAIGGGIALAVGGASLPARHVVNFADRAFLFNLLAAGTVRGRSAIWSVAGDGLTFTGTGSGDREFTELDGEITAVGVIRRSLVVYSRTSIVVGEETFIPDSPVSYSPVVSRGRGVWAPDSLLQFADVHAGLAEDGFWSFDGSTFINIGAPINDDILSRVNRQAVSTIWGMVKPDWNMAIWFLPMSGNSKPNEAWGYNYVRNIWTQLDANAYFSGVQPTAGVVTLLGPALAWNDALFAAAPTDQWNEQLGKTWIDFRGESLRPTAIVGLNNGVTRVLNDELDATTVALLIETPDFTFEGSPFLEDTREGRQLRAFDVVRPDDIVTLDELDIHYTSSAGVAATLFVRISSDGGATWTGLGSVTGEVTLPATSTGQRGRVHLYGRFSGEHVRFQITNTDPSTGVIRDCRIRPEDFHLAFRKAGESR
jgi:hypothetical protein